jgi:hypothetical protein
MTQATSDWQQLRDLSDEDRQKQYERQQALIYACAMMLEEEITEDTIKVINGLQKHLDRIKALVMARGKE